jgi:tetratricopeptide (TPR) repeat protein
MEKTEFEKHFSQALKAGQKRDYRKAVAILEYLAAQGAADGDEGHPEVYLYLARAWHAEEMYSRATACARSYIRLRPDDGSGWFFLGRSYLAEGRYDRAVPALKRSVECNPSSLDARALLGMSYLKGKKPTLARGVFEDALALAPDDARLNQGYLNALFVEAVRTFRKGDAETARQMLTFLINNDIDGVAPRLYLAHALRDLGYLPESLSQYEAAMEFEPEDATLRWYPVSILLELGDVEEASRRMAELGEAFPEGGAPDRMVSLVIIRNHLDGGAWGKATEAARAYIKKYGSDAQSHALMGEALRNLGNLKDSLAHFNRALELDRENPAPRYGILMLFAGARDWSALLAETQRAARANCDSATVSYYQVLARANLDENPEDVLPGIQEQVRAHGAVPELLVALGKTYFRLGLADLALGWYRKVTELEDGNEEAWLGYIASCEELAALPGADAANAHAASAGGKSRDRDIGTELGDAYASYLERWADNSSIRGDFIAWLVANERWEEAADNTECLEDYADSEQLLRQLALYRRKAGQFRQSAVLYRNMLRKKPDDRVLLANLVFCLDRMGESASALRLMKEANKAFKPNADTLLIEGRLHARTGDFDQSLTVFRIVMDAYPDDPRGWEEASAVYARQGVREMAELLAQKARDVRLKAEKKARRKLAQ